jgi:transcriptional regulator with XRE-family HTH domain
MDIKEINKIVGKNIKRIRKSKWITQNDLAQFLKISQQAIAHYEIGQSRIDYNKAKDLAILLNVPVLDFFKSNTSENININDLYKIVSDYFNLSENDLKELVQFTEVSNNISSKANNNQIIFYQDIKKLIDIYISGDEKLISIVNHRIGLIFNMLEKK